MAAEASVSLVGFFLPIFSFMLVFVVLYSILIKTAVLGDGKPMNLFIAFVLASFFIMEASLVDFVKFNSAWVGVFAILIFFILTLLAFTGEDALGVLKQGNWFAWVLLGGVVALFIFSAAYTFNWVINWSSVNSWITTDWFGMILLLIIAGIVSIVITRGAAAA